MPNAMATTRPRVAPWIGIGTSGSWGSSAEALAAADLDFKVRQERLFWNREEYPGSQVVYAEPAPMFGNVRDDTDTLLGCVTPQYKVIQNDSAFSIIDPFLGNDGRITHAGMTEDGLCFMIAEVGVRSFGCEDYTMYLMATNSFNTKYPCQIIMTPLRIICQNMYRKLVPDRLFLAKHTLSISEKLKQLANSNMLERKIGTFEAIVCQSQEKELDYRKMQALLAMLFPYPKPNSPRELAYKARADEVRQMFEDVYYDAPDNIVHHGTAFGFVNAYYDYLSHRAPTRNMGNRWEDRRLQGLVDGVDIDMAVIREALK